MAGKDFRGPNLGQLPLEFYTRTDVVQIARELLGKVLVTEINGQRTAGRITETEAYRAPDDRACHAFGNRRSKRTEVMFWEGGHAYIYLCYGMHHLFNVVTGPEGMAHAVLIRAVEPLEGLAVMQERRGEARRVRPAGNSKPDIALTTGPGALAQALGLKTVWTGQNMLLPETPVWIEDTKEPIMSTDILAGPRIGVDFAGECAAWPWRFWLKNTRFHK